MKLKAIFAACISLMVMSSSANASNLNNGEHGISARATSAKQLVDVYAGGNYVSISSSNMAIMFDIDNRDSERAATVDATCTIHYDQAQRFLFQSTPTPPDTISGTLFRSGNGNKFQSMWPGQNTGFLVFNKGNATIDHIECKIDGFQMHEPNPVVTFFKDLINSF